MQINSEFIPIKRMVERVQKAKEDSDTTYFYDLMLFGEFITKWIISALVAGINEDKDRNKYRQLHRLVRADGIGEWSSVLDEILTGVTSQFLQNTISQNEQKELQTKVKSDTWQYQSVKSLTDVFILLNLEAIVLPERLQWRQWFSYFAQLRNGTKGHGAMQPNECSKACIGLEKSIMLIIENFYIFKREWAYLNQNLNSKYRVTNLSFSSKQFEDLKTSRNPLVFTNGLYIYFNNITQVELIFSDPDALDFYLPNGNFKEKKFESLSYLTNQRQFNDSASYLVPANELPQSETEGLGELKSQENCLGNIPPLSSEYVKRKHLENDLKSVLVEEDRYPIVTLRGRGGIGKTTLALSVIHEISKTSRFNLILWFSSRDIDLKLEGPKPVKNMMLTEMDVAEEFMKLIGSRENKKSNEKINYLATEMTKSEFGKILFVFDNFETVQNPTELFNWIDTYIRNPNKVLITSRISKSFKADYPIEILGMDDNESKELIKQTSQKLQIEGIITKEVVDNIINEAQGHPYVMKILLGQIAKNPKSLQIERIMATQEEILVALFRRTFNTLTPIAKRVFLTLCSWRSVVPLIALEAVMLRPEIQEKLNIEEAIEELQKSSFIDIVSSNTDSSMFISVPLAAFLFGKSELEVSQMKIAILSDRDLLLEFGATQQIDIQKGLMPRIERKFRSIAKKISSGTEKIETHRQALEFLCRKFPYAWNFMYQLFIENGYYVEAEESLRELLKCDIDLEERKITLERISSLNIQAKNWFAQVNTHTELCLLPNATLEEISDTANIINNYIFKDDNLSPKLELDDEIKESLIKKVAEVMEKKIFISSNVTATDYSRLAWLYMHLKEQEKAIQTIEKGLAKDYNNMYCIKLARKLNMPC